MNKYKAITKESKKLRNSVKKEQFEIISLSFASDKGGIAKSVLHISEVCAILAAYQIILDRDIYNMDEDKLDEVLSKMKIDKDNFYEHINMYDNYSYIEIERYLRLVTIMNDETKTDEEKYDEAMKSSMEGADIANNVKKHITLNKEDHMDSEMISKIDDLVDTIYEQTIKSKVTNEELKESDLIKSAYGRKNR